MQHGNMNVKLRSVSQFNGIQHRCMQLITHTHTHTHTHTQKPLRLTQQLFILTTNSNSYFVSSLNVLTSILGTITITPEIYFTKNTTSTRRLLT
jgi:hypothetical protein